MFGIYNQTSTREIVIGPTNIPKCGGSLQKLIFLVWYEGIIGHQKYFLLFIASITSLIRMTISDGKTSR